MEILTNTRAPWSEQTWWGAGMGRFCCLITPSSLIKQENDYRECNSPKCHQGIAHLHSCPTSQGLHTWAGLLEILFSAEQKSQGLENPPWCLQGRNATAAQETLAVPKGLKGFILVMPSRFLPFLLYPCCTFLQLLYS